MKRPKVTDTTSERLARRAAGLAGAAVAFAAAAVLLTLTKGGMLADRFPVGVGTPDVLPSMAVPLALVLLGLALVLAGLGRWGGAARPSRLATTAGASAVAMWLWHCVVSGVGQAPRAGIGECILLFAVVAVGFLATMAGRKPLGLIVGVSVVVAGGAIVAALGVREYAEQFRSGDTAWRIFGGYVMPNFLAGLLVATLSLTAAVFLGVRERVTGIVVGAAMALQVLALLLTQSRLGMVALAVAVVVFVVSCVVGSVLQGGARRRLGAMVAVIVIMGAAGARPVISRLRASRDQSYSARFRVMTWQGVTDMIRARPLRGWGAGSFDTAYPRFARVGYTQHAHNSFLQMASQAGVPALLLLLVCFGAAVVAGVGGLRRNDGQGDAVIERRLLTAGLLAATAGILTHSCFDSDLYVPGIAFVAAWICGLLIGARLQTPGRRAPAARGVPTVARSIVGVLGGVALAAAGVLLVLSRARAIEGFRAMSIGDAYGAIEGFRAAARMDPLEPEYRLALARILEGSDRPEKARAEYEAAVRLARTGKTCYRFGRYLVTREQLREAAEWFEAARRHDPLYLRNHLALAEAYRATGRERQARAVYQGMVKLHEGPIGRVRAIPEVVDWEYGLAYAGLAEAALGAGRFVEAAPLLDRAYDVLSELWRTRHEPMVLLRVSADSMREATARYEWVLDQRVRTFEATGDAARARLAEEDRASFRADRERDQKAAEAASGG